MLFVFRLANAQKMRVREVLDMSAAEFSLWREFYQRYGFDTDRLEWTIANAGCATSQSMGARIKASDLVPQFYRPTTDNAALIAKLSALPGAKVRRITKEEKAAARAADKQRRGDRH